VWKETKAAFIGVGHYRRGDTRLVRVRLLRGFDDLDQETWGDLVERSDTRAVFLTRTWLETWWRALGEGTLLLLAASSGDRIAAVAPLCARDGVVTFLGTDSSDYLDFLGGVTGPALAALLGAAREEAGAHSFRLAVLPEGSPTAPLLAAAAERLGMTLGREDAVPAPTLAAAGLHDAARKQSLRRHEQWFRSHGDLAVVHARTAAEVVPQLDRFFEQHVERCTAAPYDSLFEDERHRSFYRRLAGLDAPWLRFTRVDWNGAPIAFHFGMSFEGSFLWYKPSFDLALARRSPGEVLLRQLLLAAAAEGVRTFDFGIGDEAFKYRFATAVPRVRTWTLDA
jgi:CelD/BcsL family acetyltransferase involved in cellulose biosynthesis